MNGVPSWREPAGASDLSQPRTFTQETIFENLAHCPHGVAADDERGVAEPCRGQRPRVRVEHVADRVPGTQDLLAGVDRVGAGGLRRGDDRRTAPSSSRAAHTPELTSTLVLLLSCPKDGMRVRVGG